MKHQQSQAGFTLIELLLSMFILGIGLVAVASIFPVAGYLQKSAMSDVFTLQTKRHAEAIVKTRGIPSGLSAGTATVQAAPASALGNSGTYPLRMRCYPTHDVTGNDSAATDRSFYWVPLYRNNGTTASPDWVTYVFILNKKRGASYTGGSGVANSSDPNAVPKVASFTASGVNGGNELTNVTHGGFIQPGDQILGSNGQIFQVSEVTGSTVSIAGQINGSVSAVWYGRANAANEVTPTTRIIVVGGKGGQ